MKVIEVKIELNVLDPIASHAITGLFRTQKGANDFIRDELERLGLYTGKIPKKGELLPYKGTLAGVTWARKEVHP